MAAQKMEIKLLKGEFSQDQNQFFVSLVKLLLIYNMASSGLWKMFTYIILVTPKWCMGKCFSK